MCGDGGWQQHLGRAELPERWRPP